MRTLYFVAIVCGFCLGLVVSQTAHRFNQYEFEEPTKFQPGTLVSWKLFPRFTGLVLRVDNSQSRTKGVQYTIKYLNDQNEIAEKIYLEHELISVQIDKEPPQYNLGTLVTWKLCPHIRGLIVNTSRKQNAFCYTVKYLNLQNVEVSGEYLEHELLLWEPK